MKVTLKDKELAKLLNKITERRRKLLKAELNHKLKKVQKHEFKLLCLLLDLNKLHKEMSRVGL